MTQPFVVSEEDVFVSKATVNSQMLVASAWFGIGLPEDFAQDSQKKADLLECRLSRLEQALNLDPIS